ncbi:hypothetical protein F66182_2836 [Fusarium sp. NRRL 66182]|nr:hypothetical protein F66182_2836 [Fusarium sp. NRRL 66182]
MTASALRLFLTSLEKNRADDGLGKADFTALEAKPLVWAELLPQGSQRTETPNDSLPFPPSNLVPSSTSSDNSLPLAMRRYKSFPLLTLVLASPALAGPGQSLDKICKDTEGTYGCEAEFKIPFGSEPITTCVNTSPCGVQILTNSRNICDIVTDAMGHDNFVTAYPAWCREAPRAIREVKTEKSVWVDGKLNGAGWIPLAVSVGIEDEFRNRGFQFKNNKATVVSRDLANKDGWVVLRAAEIGTKSYMALVEGLVFCEESSCTNEQTETIMKWFIDWIRRGTEIRNGKLATMLADWEKTFDEPYRKRIATIKSASATAQRRINTASSKVSTITRSICPKNVCTGKVASANLKNGAVSAALKAVKDLQNIAAACNAAEEKRNYILLNFLGNIQAAYNLPPEILAPNHINHLLQAGKLDTLRGIMHGFGTVTSELNMYILDIKRNIGPLIELTKHEARARAALAKVNALLTTDWKNNKDLGKTASSRKVRDGFIQIQSFMKAELQGSLATLANAIDAFDSDFLKFPLRANKMEFAFGAAPYDRWFDLQFKYPCRKDVTETFTEAGFSKDHTWPVFTPCTFTPQRVDLPKYWMPYMKYRFVKQ